MEGEGESSLPELYDQAFSLVENGKQLEQMGDLNGAKSNYMQGVEIFFKITKMEKNEKKRKLIEENLQVFISKMEVIDKLIKSSPHKQSVDVLPFSIQNNFPSYVPQNNFNNVNNNMYPNNNFNQFNNMNNNNFNNTYNYNYNNNFNNFNNFNRMNNMNNNMNNMNMNNNNNMNNNMNYMNNNNMNISNFNNNNNILNNKPEQKLDPSAPSSEDVLGMLDLPDPPGYSNKSQKSSAKASHSKRGNNNFGSGGNGNRRNSGKKGGKHPQIEASQEILDDAIKEDEQKNYFEAIELYIAASEEFMSCLKISSLSKVEKNRIRDKVSTILGRVEVLKKHEHKNETEATAKVNSGISGEGLSQKELEVLRKSSYIRNMTLYPWMESDRNDKFKYSDSFKDKHGLLPLSQKQRNKFGKWKRISNLSNKPKIIDVVTPYSITQTLITDCSFVSSLTVTALYEKTFKKKLITNILYPQNNKGNPLYNPSGKYLVKLFLNGCYRKIEIDDYLPVSKNGELLCSFSNNKNEFWVSLLEKGFLKIMGGYDFPGSTSCEDLHVLTGWIPERVGFSDSQSDKLDVDKLFNRLVSGQKFGDCLITLATKKLEDKEADELGLVPSHAYAVLRAERLGNHKFLQIKNPWAMKRWKGRFSVEDNTNWTPQLRKALNYNPNKERQFDNGIFWMCLEDVMKYYSAVYMNWNPELFPFRITQHYFWDKRIGPKNDSFNLGYNPQFLLDVEIPKENNNKNSSERKNDNIEGSVWILLTKHMENTKREEQDKNDFLTLHIYDASAPINTIDRRIFFRKGALHTGVYINSPHYLMRLDIDPNNNNSFKHKKVKSKNKFEFTVVVSQYEKKNDVSFTITAYSTIPCRFRPTPDSKMWKYKKEVVGRWTKNVSGGSTNYNTFPQNPQFRIKLGDSNNLRLLLEAPVDYSVNIQLYLCVNLEEEEDPLEKYKREQRELELKEENEKKEKEKKLKKKNKKRKVLVDGQNDEDDDEEEEEVEEDKDKDDNNNNNNKNDKNIKKNGKIVSMEHYRKDLLVGDSGSYRYGVTMIDIPKIAEGTYIAIISTFRPGQLGGFKFSVRATRNIGFLPV